MPVIIKDTNPKQFENLSRRLENPSQLLNRIHKELKSYVIKGFDTAGRSIGNPWAKHSAATKGRRKPKGTYNVPQPILIETGKLKKHAVQHRILEINATGFRPDSSNKKVEGAFDGVEQSNGEIVKREFYSITPKFANRLVDISGSYIVRGKVRRLG